MSTAAMVSIAFSLGKYKKTPLKEPHYFMSSQHE